MKLVLSFALVAVWLVQCTVSEEEDGWSWGNKQEPTKQSYPTETEDAQQGDILQFSASDAVLNVVNQTEADKIVDEILVSNRQGRALDGLDEVYSDPNVQDALQKGDDSEARNIIKDRLCLLGLMQCDENVEGKRPFISPEDLQYAQPVSINPIGRPIPTIPLNGPVRGSYGPPKPLPHYPGPNGYPSKYGPPNKFRPPGPHSPNKPPRRGYGPPPPPPNKPFYGPPGKPIFSGHGNDFYEGNEFVHKPSYVSPIEDVEQPYAFEHSSHQKDKRVEVVVNAHGGAAQTTGSGTTGSGLLQHVHHHYHHNLEGNNQNPTVIVKPVPVPVASAAAAVSSTLDSSINGNYFSGSSTFRPGLLTNSGFSPIAGNGGLTIGGGGFGGSYGGQTIANYGGTTGSFGGIRPIHETPNDFAPGTFSLNSYGTNSFGNSYGSSDFYKKELNLNSVNGNYIQSAYADKYHGSESNRAENLGCVCVPYDQCPSSDIIGRKEDFYLPLDPRSLKSDIEALPEEEERVITDGNGTMTIIRVTKGVNLNDTIEEKQAEEEKADEKKKISKREADKREAPVEENATPNENVEGRQRQYGGVGGLSGMLDAKKITPTFGVSFGLPNQGGGGYPINPYGPNPLNNPYGGTIGHHGINLGLISVNPLLSVQVSKDDYGQKIVKPFVNLHITPNNYLVSKLEDILNYKKGVVLNKHKHLHYHKAHHLHKRPHYHYVPQVVHTDSHVYHPSVHSEPVISSHPGPIEYGGPYSSIDSGPEISGSGPIYSSHTSPVEYDSHHPSVHSGPTISSHPGHIYHSSHHGPQVYLGETGIHKPHVSYYDDPSNYGSTYSGGYDDSLNSRNFNISDIVSGIPVLSQYQDYINKILSVYAQSHKKIDFSGYHNDDSEDSFSSEIQNLPNVYNPNTYRSGKALSNSNVVRFPTDNDLIFNYQQLYNTGLNNYYNPQMDYSGQLANNLQDDDYIQITNLFPQSNSKLFPQDAPLHFRGGKSLSASSSFKFPSDRRKRDLTEETKTEKTKHNKRQAYYGQNFGRPATCGPRHVCCRRPNRPQVPAPVRHQCGTRHSQGINGRIKNPVYIDGDSEFGEYPWQVAILKKDPKESVYVCGGTLIDNLHVLTAAHCAKTYTGNDLRVRLGEWDVNHDVEFYPYVERDVITVNVHPEFYAGTLYNDIAILRLDKPVDFTKSPHISPACLPSLHDDYSGTRCWTTGWGKDAFGDFGKYQNILKEVDVPIISHSKCQRQLQQTRLGYDFKLHPGFVCAGGEEGKDACKGDGGGPMVCERGGTWQVVGVVSWGIGCGQFGVPGVYVKVAHYLDWIRQVTQRY